MSVGMEEVVAGIAEFEARGIEVRLTLAETAALIADWRKRGEALEPFAIHARLVNSEFADHSDDIIAAGIKGHQITFGDFRRALAALTPQQPPPAA